MKFFAKNRKNMENAGFTGVLARTLEEVSWLKEEKIQLWMLLFMHGTGKQYTH